MASPVWDAPSARLAAVASTLSKTPIFAASAHDELEQIAGVCRSIRLARNEYLFRENEPAAGFFIVQSGAISVQRMDSAGKEMVIHVFRSTDSFAEAALASGVGYPADARAIESSTVLLVPRQEFLNLVRRKPEMALRMLASISLHLRTLVSRLDDLQLKDVETRLLFWIIARLREAGPAAKSIHIRGTKRSLALELGVTSETLSRTFASLRDRSLINVVGTRIDVPDFNRLDTALKQRLAGPAPSRTG